MARHLAIELGQPRSSANARRTIVGIDSLNPSKPVEAYDQLLTRSVGCTGANQTGIRPLWGDSHLVRKAVAHNGGQLRDRRWANYRERLSRSISVTALIFFSVRGRMQYAARPQQPGQIAYRTGTGTHAAAVILKMPWALELSNSRSRRTAPVVGSCNFSRCMNS